MKGKGGWGAARPAGPSKVPVARPAGKGPPQAGARPAAVGQVRPGQKVAQPGARPQGTVAPRPALGVGVRPQSQIAAKRPGEVAAGGPGAVIKKPPVPANATGKDAPKLSVTSQSKIDDIGIQTLVGDYAEKGTNHNKKFYQKLQKIPGHEDIKVFLYFWDNRDGADFSGWWFGDQVGGTQVWARNPSASQTPPRTGWKVPWDSAMAKPGLLFVDPYKAAAATPATSPATTPRAQGTAAATQGATATQGAAGAGAAQNSGNAAVDLRTKKAVEKVEQVEKAAAAAVTKVKNAVASSSSTDELKELQSALQKQQSALVEAQKTTTQEVNAFRKLGSKGQTGVTELSKLLPRLRAVQASVVEATNKLKGQLGASAQKDTKESEAKHSKELEEGLVTAKDLTSLAEDSVMAIATMAEPIMSNPPPEGSDDLTKALDEVEVTAKEAQEKITEARKAITQKLTEAREFHIDVRKKAMTEYSALQNKLADAQKKIMPFRSFKRDFQAKVKAKQALTEFADKLNTAELEVEKAAMMGIAAESGQMSEEEISACQKVAEPALATVSAAIKEIELKHKTAQSAVKEELNVLKDRGYEMKKKCEGVLKTMNSQKQGIMVQQMGATVIEKVTAAEEALSACQDAEMPFLKGIEVLPAEESNKAISDCEAAAAKADAALNQAKTLIRTKQNDVRKFPKELAEKANKELSQLMTRAEACGKKINDFKKETGERKLNALMAEAVEAIKGAENKVKAHAEVAKVFSEDLNSVTEEAIKEAMEKVGDLEKEASDAMAHAKKELATKQREAKGNVAVGAMSKLQGRLKVAQDDLMKNKKASTYGDKLIKGKEALAEEMDKVDKAEAEVSKVEKLAEPVSAVENPTDEECAELGDAIVSAQNSIKSTAKSVESQVAVGVPPLKAAFSKVAERNKKIQERLDKVLGAGKKGLRERALGEAYVREGKKKTAQVDGFVEKVNEAELPFLKGIEVLPLMEATSTIENSENAAQELQLAITEARNFIAAKSVELRAFSDKEKTKPLIEELTNLTGRINAAAQKHSAFKKDTDARRKNAQLQEAGEKISKAEAEVEKVTESTAPLDNEEAAEAMSNEEAAGICQKSGAQAKLAQEAVDSCRAFLTARQKENQGVAANADTIKSLQARLAACSTALSKAKKTVSNREHKFVAKKLMLEVEEMMSSLEGEVKAAETASAPLLEKGGEQFLVAASLRTLAVALQSYGKEKGLDLDGLFKEAGGGSAMSEADFISYLEKLPEAIGHPEVEFPEERRSALAKLVDADGDGQISLAEFKAIFQLKFVCVTGISMTDVLQVSVSKTTGKVEQGEVLEALGAIVKDEATGMERVEVKTVGSGKQGFVTLKGNQGTTFLQESSPFHDFMTSLEKTLEERMAAVRKVITFVQQKGNELASHSVGPLAEAKTEINKLRPKAQSYAAELQKLKSKVATAKKDFAKAEAAEKTAHIEAKERKEAEALLKEATGNFEAAEAMSSKITSTAEGLLAAKGEDVLKFATPSSVLEEVEKLVPAAATESNKAKGLVLEEIKKIKAVKGPLAEAKKELSKITGKVETLLKKNGNTLQAVKAACKSISEAGAAKASAALREQVHQGPGFDAFFDDLATGGSIKHESLCKRLLSMDLGLSEEHAKLICRKVEAGPIGKRAFQAFVQRYYTVTTAIAITTEFEISKAKTIRKAEVDETFEVLEGPRSDEKLSLTRVRGRSLLDSTEGWLSIKGNQGSLFLKEVDKPFYSISAKDEVRLDPDFKVNEGEAVRMLKYGEVLEMLEGPKKETFPPGIRAKGKVLAGEKETGYFSIRDRQGTVFAEAEGKIYSCVSTVAMTDTFEIKDCQVVKKLQVGELFVVEEGPLKQEESGVTRVKGKTLADEKVGWITVTGNAGTTFASASKQHYAIVKEVKLQKTLAHNSDVIRTLMPGEAVQVSEKKEEAQHASIRVKVKTQDGAVGWITVMAGHVKRWTSMYKCISATALQSACKAEGASTVREIAANEILQLLDGPVEEAGDLRMRAQANKDHVEGWVTIRDSSGKRYMA